MCVCEQEGRAALLFWQKLSSVFRKIFKKKTPERAKLDAGLIVLHCQSEKEQLFYHMGYCNLKTYHFTVLAMQPRGEITHIEKQRVQPLCLSEGDDIYNSIKVAVHCFSDFDLNKRWTIHIRPLVLSSQRFFNLSHMFPHHVDVLMETGALPAFMWEGWDEERPQRRGAPRPKPKRAGNDAGEAEAWRPRPKQNPEAERPRAVTRQHGVLLIRKVKQVLPVHWLLMKTNLALVFQTASIHLQRWRQVTFRRVRFLMMMMPCQISKMTVTVETQTMKAVMTGTATLSSMSG
ncbi:unnamed protein product [Durusdinium trenchii]|uniref:Uncharacterized protein n=1 Tax=Durusdinium trenchii TaxID=1381693 RepID=A0ABP0SCR7_9DINO